MNTADTVDRPQLRDMTVTISPEAVDTIRNQVFRLQEMERTINDPEIVKDYDDLREQQRKVLEAYNSWARSIIQVLTPMGADHEIRIVQDFAPLSLFWSYTSGYHGGLIFHPEYTRGEATPQPTVIGRFSIHT